MNELVKSNLYLIHMDDELYHHGIKGMKWGVRRYQNPDGSLTEEGKKQKRRQLILRLVGGLIGTAAVAVAVTARMNASSRDIAQLTNTARKKGFYEGPGKWRYDPTKAKLKDGRVIDELQPVPPWSKWARSTGRKVKPDRYNGKFLSRVGNQSTWHYKPTKVKLKDGRVINVQPVAPWTVQNYSIGRKVLKKK